MIIGRGKDESVNGLKEASWGFLSPQIKILSLLSMLIFSAHVLKNYK
jgi:hypothetical protein